MRVLITDAYGFLGSHIVSGLLKAGVEVIGCGRNLDLARRLLPDIEWRSCDFNRDVTPEHWLERLDGIDAVINCVGIVQETAQQSLSAIHEEAPSALFKACERRGIRRVIQISALGAEGSGPTAYSTTKNAADDTLQTLNLDWLILRPSLVYGQACYGGTALFRGLAAFPFFVPVMGAERRFQPIHMSDFVEVVCRGILNKEPRTGLFNLTGPEEKSTKEILIAYRAWLGLRSAPVWEVPRILGWPILKMGDLIDWLGVRTPVTTTAYRQMEGGNTASPAPMSEAFGIEPMSLKTGFTSDISSITDRVHSRTYFLKPFLILVLGFFWVLSGLIPLATGFYGESFEGAVTQLGEASAIGLANMASLADIGLGAWLLFGRKKRFALAGQIVVSILYLISMTVFVPHLWADNLAPLLKIFPVIACAITLLALEGER